LKLAAEYQWLPLAQSPVKVDAGRDTTMAQPEAPAPLPKTEEIFSDLAAPYHRLVALEIIGTIGRNLGS
jgi:hypothetical protein